MCIRDRGTVMHDPPRHLFYSDRANQRDMLRRTGLQELHFAVREAAWPFPESLSEARTAGLFAKYVIAAISIPISRLVPGWGNTFLYLGRRA